MEEGYLIVSVYADNIAQPLEGATVKIEGIENVYETNIEGNTYPITFDTSDKDVSFDPNTKIRPYSIYNIIVTKEGMTPVIIENVEVFSGTISHQSVIMNSSDESDVKEYKIVLDDNALFGDYPAQYDDEEIVIKGKVLKDVIIPEYIIIHDGVPTNTTAKNFRVSFVDYIKNVACSEIYPTWPVETLKANILAIISFALNRVYTEWYYSKGYDFTITSVTAYDQKYTEGRTIFTNVAAIVDQIFDQYIKRPNALEPLLAHYNDGIKVNNKNWLSQWGSKDLGEKGFKAFDILKHYYGNNLSLEKAAIVDGLPTSFPGYKLKLGSCGEEVQYMQNQLNTIRSSYPGIPVIKNPNGEFNKNTEDTIKFFQKTFGLPVSGIVDFATWYKISYYFLAVKKMIQGIYDR